MPLRSPLPKNKAVDIEIVKPVFIFSDSILKTTAARTAFFSSFNVQHIDHIEDGRLIFQSGEIDVELKNFYLKSSKKNAQLVPAFQLRSPHLNVRMLVNGRKVTLEGGLNSEFRDLGEYLKISQWVWQTRDILFHANEKYSKTAPFP